MPKQFVTIKGKRVPISEITSKGKPFPFSKSFHKLPMSILENDINGNNRNIQQFERNIGLNREPSAIKFSRDNIKRLQADNIKKQTEINQRRKQAEIHKLRFGKG